jgi:hypothetical protein
MTMPSLSLEEIAARARARTITPAEKRAQRVSLIMGLRSDNSTLTRDEVATLLGKIEGHDNPADDAKKSSNK